MGRLGTKTLNKFASLSALGAGALALAPDAAEASVIYNASPITLTYTVGGGPVTWQSGDGGSTPIPGAHLGFSLYQCWCGIAGVALLPDFFLRVAPSYLATVRNISSYPFMKLVDSGVLTYGPRFPGAAPIASFKSVGGNLYSGGHGQFQNKFALFSFLNSASVVNQGWVELSLTASADNPVTEQLTIGGYAYDDSGAFLPAGSLTPVPEPGTLGSTALAALALGAVGLRRWRSARRKTA
jgi:hypothetical protein